MSRTRITLFAAISALLISCTSDSTGPVGGGGNTLTHDPILFVHGWARASDDWVDMIARFKSDGWADSELYAYNYSFVTSNASIAAEIRDQINAILSSTGATKVDIVSHSMGGISSRHYLKNLGGDAKVDAFVSLGGPNHGTDTADQCAFTPCVEMRIGSAFLAALNAGDETPGFPRYATWWSACDATINPDTSVPLTGATNTQTSCLGHGQLPTDPVVYQQVRNWIR
jgi:triacylglycerol esterase/lipase EstA (alpha/beta hydrolase family)